MTERRRRWRGAVAATLVLAAAGIWEGSGTLLLAATVPLAFLAYGSASSVRVPEGLALSRRVDPSPAPPGRPVSVTLTVSNETDETLADVRVVDRVPDELAVLHGTPRAGLTLESGETRSIEYRLVAKRGEYDFAPPRVRIRGTAAGAVATTAIDPAGDERLVCRLDADAPPLADRGSHHVGRLSSDDPGQGLTFHSTREYRHGDPAARIDWRHYAKQGTLATVNYDRWVSTTVVVVLDARPPCHVAAGPGRPTAVELGGYAATRALTALLRSGHDVGVAVVGAGGDGPAGLHWLPPGSGREQQSRAVDLFRTATDGSVDGPFDEQGGESSGETVSGGGDPDPSRASQFRTVAELAGRRAQLVLVSPALDDGAVDGLDAWAAVDRPRTLLSPDVVPANTVSGQYEAVQRRTRLARCQSTGTRTIDWRRGTPLPVILEYAFTVDARQHASRSRRAAAGSASGSGGVASADIEAGSGTAGAENDGPESHATSWGADSAGPESGAGRGGEGS